MEESWNQNIDFQARINKELQLGYVNKVTQLEGDITRLQFELKEAKDYCLLMRDVLIETVDEMSDLKMQMRDVLIEVDEMRHR